MEYDLLEKSLIGVLFPIYLVGIGKTYLVPI